MHLIDERVLRDGPVDGFVRVVELPDDLFDVHLVAEASRRGLSNDPPDYRAPTTICGRAGYRETRRATNACAECERAIPDAMPAVITACRAAFGGLRR